jgi:hypothetical protein
VKPHQTAAFLFLNQALYLVSLPRSTGFVPGQVSYPFIAKFTQFSGQIDNLCDFGSFPSSS